MSDFSISFQQLETNVKILIENKKKSEQKLLSLEEEYNKLKMQLETAQMKVEELEEKNKILRIAKGNQDGDNREIKLKINEIVREVDKCIAQLNQ